jgi:class 3 adenylate cyclase
MAAAPLGHERRKVVTVIFADVVGSTALGERVDPETLRWAMQRWFERMRDAIERHGGAVENYVGDAVMGVFGIPVVHEDDALRAMRAAAAMRDEAIALRYELRRERGVELAMRVGVNTGEAVTGSTLIGGSFTAGDIVNVAARLEQAARPGEILLGGDTFRLVRHAVDAAPVAPLKVKGKRAALEAFRLIDVASGAHGRPQRPRARMVGRQRERRRVLDAFHQAVADRSCQLFTVLGTAGVGKSRLVAEVLETIGGAGTVAGGRCLPYGDGLTWWPLVEALSDTGLLESARTEAPDACAVVTGLLAPTGEAVAPEEASWAIRKVLEALARRRPLVLVIDDLQWAEPTFVDVIEHISDWARDAALLLLVMARPELLDARPGWGGGKPNATSILLEPLADQEAADLLRHHLGMARLTDRASARILSVAEGNPLYVEEIVAMLRDQGALGSADIPIVVPPTIQALLAARLDGLSEGERTVIEAAAIEGKEFARERVQALVDDRTRDRLDGHLLALVRTDLVRPGGWRRRRVPLSSPAHSRRRLRRDVEGHAGSAPRALRRLARGAPCRSVVRRRVAWPSPRARRGPASRARRQPGDDVRTGCPRVGEPTARRKARTCPRRSGGRAAARARGGPCPRRREADGPCLLGGCVREPRRPAASSGHGP